MLFGIIALTCGCNTFAQHEKTVNLTVAHVPSRPLHVTSVNGHIEVEQAAGSEVQITAVIRANSLERLEATRVQAIRVDGALWIEARWPENRRRSSEGCKISVSVPDVSELDLRSSNGKVKAKGLSGMARLKTSNGAITLDDHSGPVRATTSNGSVSVSGTIGNAQLRTSNGKIAASGLSGAVDAVTSNGSITLGLSRDYEGSLDMKTSNASVAVDSSLEPYVVSRRKKKAASLQIGRKNVRSKATTSNGSIRVERR